MWESEAHVAIEAKQDVGAGGAAPGADGRLAEPWTLRTRGPLSRGKASLTADAVRPVRAASRDGMHDEGHSRRSTAIREAVARHGVTFTRQCVPTPATQAPQAGRPAVPDARPIPFSEAPPPHAHALF